MLLYKANEAGNVVGCLLFHSAVTTWEMRVAKHEKDARLNASDLWKPFYAMVRRSSAAPKQVDPEVH